MITRQGARSLKVHGQATGRAIAFVIALGGQRTLYGTGAGEFAVARCKGDLGGVFAGPREGDIGDWGIKGWHCPSG